MEERVPTSVRLRFAHAVAQAVADGAGIELLHIKGIATHPALLWPGRGSSDTDVLVDPDRANDYVRALIAAGWELRGGFASSSAFEHSATLHHKYWGYVDVHRIYPGFGAAPSAVFAELVRESGPWEAAGVRCEVPSIPAQRLILLLHAARSGGDDRALRDIDAVWSQAPQETKATTLELAHRLDAGLALAAALGRLDEWTDHPEHDLWEVVSRGGTRIDEWRARVKAAPTFRDKVRLIVHAPLVNTDHLAMLLGRQATRGEVLREFFARPARGLREELARRCSR